MPCGTNNESLRGDLLSLTRTLLRRRPWLWPTATASGIRDHKEVTASTISRRSPSPPPWTPASVTVPGRGAYVGRGKRLVADRGRWRSMAAQRESTVSWPDGFPRIGSRAERFRVDSPIERQDDARPLAGQLPLDAGRIPWQRLLRWQRCGALLRYAPIWGVLDALTRRDAGNKS